MSEIPEDLKITSSGCLGTGSSGHIDGEGRAHKYACKYCDGRGFSLREDRLIERIARAEAKVSALEAELQTFRDGENYIKQFLDAKAKCAVMYNPEEVYGRGRLQFWAEENGYSNAIAALEAENGRLKAPVSDAECEALDKATYYAMGATLDRLIPTLNALIAARAQQPSPAQPSDGPCSVCGDSDGKGYCPIHNPDKEQG